MTRRKKQRLDKAVEARRRARRLGLAPAGTRVIPDKRKKPEKHKKNHDEWPFDYAQDKRVASDE